MNLYRSAGPVAAALSLACPAFAQKAGGGAARALMNDAARVEALEGAIAPITRAKASRPGRVGMDTGSCT